jgi:RNA polymerase sigma-70 factor (ECF subfamily)
MAAPVPALVDEGDVLRRAIAGQDQAFAALVRGHQAMVFGLALHFFHDRDRAEEIAQEVFLRLYRGLAEIESAAHLTFWLRRVTAQRCIDEGRRLRARPLLFEEPPDVPDDRAPPDPLLHRRLRRGLLDLSPLQRLALTLRYQEGLEPGEIGEVLGLRQNTVRNHLRRGLAALRASLGDER